MRWEEDGYFFSQLPWAIPPSTSSADERIGMSQHPFGIEPKSNSWCDTGKTVARSLLIVDRAAGYYQCCCRKLDGCRAFEVGDPEFNGWISALPLLVKRPAIRSTAR